ncbi:glycosyltransferase family protein [Anthocerotibacter panamensis]|uniref:hypothetical protein n=1 Tax=Anthocerotibacter panamensis TaxID=2857077 RepID=UPI001C408AD5|nr:hypothetical protein [Anthocerotibacter panamensis]
MASAHGWGHTTRLAAVVERLVTLYPTLPVYFNTPAPQWLVDVHVRGCYHYRPVALDVGIVQSNSFDLNEPATLQRLEQLVAGAEPLLDAEAAFAQEHGVALIVADCPPLAVLLAQRLGVPVWYLTNFGWDFIYCALGPRFQPWATWAEHLYQQADLLLKLPFAEALSAFPRTESVPIVVNQPRYSRAETRAQLNLPPEAQVVLLTFGGLGLETLPYANLLDFPEWLFLTTDRQAPSLPNLRVAAGDQWRMAELCAAADLALIKPGYSTVAECCACGVTTFCTGRPNFAEAAVLIAGLREQVPHYILTPEQVQQGPWTFLRAPPLLPLQPGTLSFDGATVVARRIAHFLGY